jgi:hypothetical protein
VSAARGPLTAAELQSRIVITVPEYSATFFADERTVRRDIKDGRLQALQVGTTWRILVAPLLRQCGLDLETETSEAPSATEDAAAPTLRLAKTGQSHDHPPAA